jgi:hypothetical protein
MISFPNARESLIRIFISVLIEFIPKSSPKYLHKVSVRSLYIPTTLKKHITLPSMFFIDFFQ